MEDSAIEASLTYVASEVANNGGKETLNDIRFGGWGTSGNLLLKGLL